MKSKQDIHLAIAVLAMMTFKGGTREQKRQARKVCSALCWVMDYPSDFDKFWELVKSQNLFGDISHERLDEIVEDSVRTVMEEHDGGFTE